MTLDYAAPTRIIDSRHPSFLSGLTDWEKWRMTYRGGDEFRQKYLKRFSHRETPEEFSDRLHMTPVPTYAKAALNDIRNAIFQRMRDISRVGGSASYRQAVMGEGYGVDRRGSSMNSFLGVKVLTELLSMGRVGVFVDNSVIKGGTLADAAGATPYLYEYQIEDILSWTCLSADKPSEYRSILLRDTVVDYDRRTLLPMNTFQRFRLLWVDDTTGRVKLQFYNLNGQEVDRDNNPGGPIELGLNRIPFVMLDIVDSLIKDVCGHQIALMNLCSSDVWYALKANFAIYTEQRDMRQIGNHLKPTANPDGSATTGGQGAHANEITVGTMQGRAYAPDMDRPGFINPSPEPLKASMELQAKLEADIRKLVNLAVATVASRASAESKSMDNQGLEGGLSFIGLVLENAERMLAQHWAAYEDSKPDRRQVATIKYPDRYSLKSDADRIEEATKLSKLMFSVPGRKVKREIAKNITLTLLNGKVNVATLDEINKEIDGAEYLTSDPVTIIEATEAGLMPERIGSAALGLPDDAYLEAREDHANRIARIQEAQAEANPGPLTMPGERMGGRVISSETRMIQDAKNDPAARGAPDLSADPAQAASKEKTASRDRTMQGSRKKRQRGRGRFKQPTGE
jgi:hypothetical protein